MSPPSLPCEFLSEIWADTQLSLLFVSSTTLTEWITTQRVSQCWNGIGHVGEGEADDKYPAYATYKQLVGQFTPMDTAIKYIWTTARGTRAALKAKLQPPARAD